MKVPCEDTWLSLKKYYLCGVYPIESYVFSLLLQDFDLARKCSYALTDHDINMFLTLIQEIMPSISYGDKEAINAWVRYKGLVGLYKSNNTDILTAVKLCGTDWTNIKW